MGTRVPDPFYPGEYQAFCDAHPLFGVGNFADHRARLEVQHLFYHNRKKPTRRYPLVPREEAQTRVNLWRFRQSINARTEQAADNPSWDEYGPATKDDRRNADATIGKTLQYILSTSTDFMAFERGDVNLQDIIIDPRKLTNTALENLGLSRFIPPPRTPRTEDVAIRAKAIPAVKEMLATLEPVRYPEDTREGSYFRTMRLSAGDHEGMLLVTYNKDGSKKLAKTDLYNGIRRVNHIENGSRKETRSIAALRHLIKSLRSAYDDWSAHKDSEEILQLLEECRLVVDSLQNVQLDSKIKMRDALKRCADDLAGNPGAALATLVGASNRSLDRMDEIERIIGHIYKDESRLRALADDQEQPVRNFMIDVNSKHRHFAIINDLGSPLSEAHKRKITANLNDLKEDAASRMNVRPLIKYAPVIGAQVDAILQLLDEPEIDRRKVSLEFLGLTWIMKLAKCEMEVAELTESISCHASHVSPLQYLSKIRGLHARFGGPKYAPKDPDTVIAPGQKTPGYNPMFNELHGMLSSAETLILNLVDLYKKLPEDERTPAIFANHPSVNGFVLGAKEFIKSVDWDLLLQMVPIGDAESTSRQGELEI